jgi:hypothetical protein
MTVSARFGAARELWMARYIPALAEYRAKYQPSAPEVLLKLSDDGGPAPFRDA